MTRRIQEVGRSCAGFPILEVPQGVFDAWVVALGSYPDLDEEVGTYHLLNRRHALRDFERPTVWVGQLYITPPRGPWVAGDSDDDGR